MLNQQCGSTKIGMGNNVFTAYSQRGRHIKNVTAGITCIAKTHYNKVLS